MAKQTRKGASIIMVALLIVVITSLVGGAYVYSTGSLPGPLNKIPGLDAISQKAAAGIIILDDAKEEALVGRFLGVSVGIIPKDSEHRTLSPEALAVFKNIPHTEYLNFIVTARNSGNNPATLCLTGVGSNMLVEGTFDTDDNCQTTEPGTIATWTSSDIDISEELGERYFEATITGTDTDGVADTLHLRREFTLYPDDIELGDIEVTV